MKWSERTVWIGAICIILIVLWPHALISPFFPSINNTEVIEIPKYLTFTNIEALATPLTPNADLAANTQVRNIGYIGSDYYIATVDYDSGEFKYTLNIYSITGVDGTSSLEHSYQTGVVDSTLNSIILRTYGTKIIGIMCLVDDSGADVNYFSYYDGASWSDGTYAVGNNNVSYIIDALFTVTRLIYVTEWSGTFYIGTYPYAGAGAAVELEIDSSDEVYGGYINVDGDYECVVRISGEFVKAVYDTGAGSWSTTAMTGLTEPGNYDPTKQQYYARSGSEYLLDEDSFHYKDPYTQTWTRIAASTTAFLGVVWTFDASDLYQINYLLWDQKIYKLFNSGGFGVLQSITSINARTGFDDWFNDPTNEDIYQATISSFATQQCQITTNGYDPPSFVIVTSIEPIEDQLLSLYDETDTLRGYTFIRTYIGRANNIFEYTCQSPIEIDLNTPVDFTSSAIDAPAILQYVIDNYCSFLQYSATSINDTPDTPYSLPFKGTVRDVFDWASKQEGYFISIRPDFTVYYDGMTESGLTLVKGTDQLDEPGWKKTPLKQPRISITGAIVNGVRLTSEVFGSPGFGTYRDSFPMIDNQTDLDAMRDALLAKKNLVLISIGLPTYNKAYFYVGTTVPVTFSDYGLSADTFYINSTIWDLQSAQKDCKISATDALLIYDPSSRSLSPDLQSERDITDRQITNVNADIENQAEIVQTKLDIPVLCALTRTTAWTHDNTGNYDPIEWTAETEDNANMHDNSTNNTRITIPEAGWYYCTCSIYFNNASDKAFLIKIDGVDQALYQAFTYYTTYSQLIYCTAGQYIEFFVYQNTGSDLSTYSTYYPTCKVIKMCGVGRTV